VPERTLVLVKPDGVARGLVGEVLGRIERKGYRLVAVDLRTLDRETAQAHYAEHAEKPFFGELVEFITSGPLLAAVVEGPDVIEAWRSMMGATSSRAARPRTIRRCSRCRTTPSVFRGEDLVAANRDCGSVLTIGIIQSWSLAR
jgi:nucleoside-diphosphate kinase